MAKEGAPYIDVELLTPNEYSRPQIPIESAGILPFIILQIRGQQPLQTGNYFENLATTMTQR